MIYSPPSLVPADEAVLEAIASLKDNLRFYLRTPRRWHGSLRRTVFAQAVQGSNSIEGYHASIEDVEALMAGEEAEEASRETASAISGYRDAMTYVLQRAPACPGIDASLLLSLHFMMVKHDLRANPGQWRPGAVWVQDPRGNVVYEAPDREAVETLLAELAEQANETGLPTSVTAAMAHLNLTLIHPFSDGNGRMARCLQTLVLARDGTISPEFSSIEEYLGSNTQAYYAVLSEVAQGSWSPHRDARPWIEFCLTAHYRQSLMLQRRIRETEALWDACEQAAASHGLPERVVGALCDAARGRRIRRSLYSSIIRSSAGETISDNAATRDLQALTTAGLLDPQGEKRGRSYEGSELLRALWGNTRLDRSSELDDPYEVAGRGERGQSTLPGI